jgi:hypothetical protein
MASDLRGEIFELRSQNPPVSWSVIAGRLGISRSKAQRIFNRRAPLANSTPAAAREPAGYELDPDIRERRKSVELARLQLAESDLSLRAIEQQQRLAVLQGKGGSDGQLVALLMGQLGDLKDALRELRNSGAGAPRSVIEQLSEFATVQKTLASFAPTAAPSGAADLEWRLGIRRLDLEDQRIAREREKELALRQAEVDSVNMRNRTIAQFVESFGPMLSQVAEKYLEDRLPKRPAAGAGAPQLPATPGEPAAAVAEVQGSCPMCRIAVGKSSAEPEPCPGCGTMLTIDSGLIVVAGGTEPAEGSAAAESNGQTREAQRFAS